MTYEETWKELIGDDLPDTPATLHLRKLTLAFYKAGEVQAITNVDRIVADALMRKEEHMKATQQ